MLNHPRILVADADPGICRLLRRHFGTAPYTVVTAETGREALDLIRRTPPDLAILSTELVAG
jgi:DNA-binding response OmpR family regulator